MVGHDISQTTSENVYFLNVWNLSKTNIPILGNGEKIACDILQIANYTFSREIEIFLKDREF